MLDIRMLGPLAVRIDGEVVELRRPKLKELFTALVLADGSPQSADRLIDQLWDPGKAPASAVNLIEKYVSDLRVRVGRATIVTHPAGVGYSLPRAGVEFDVDRLREFVGSARQAFEQGRAAEADALVGRAVALVRGEAFVDVEGREFVQPALRSVGQLLDAASGLQIEIDLAMGRTADAITACHEALDRDPHNESRIAQLVRAYCVEGRRTEALRRIQSARTMYGNVGLDIGPDLSALEDRILREDPTLFLVVAPPSGLPEAQPVYERDDELSLVSRDLSVERGVWLVGEKGVGKSNLALAVAHLLGTTFGDGAWWVDCSDTTDPRLAFDDALGLLGVIGSSEPQGQLAAYLRPRRALLVFDGCGEAMSDALAELVAAVGDSSSRVVVTSRHVPRVGFARNVGRWPTDEHGDDPRGARAFLAAADLDPDSADVATWGAAWDAVRSCDGLPADIIGRARSMENPQLVSRGDVTDELERRMSVFAGRMSSEALQAVAGFGLLEHQDVDFHLQRLVAEGRASVRKTPYGLRYGPTRRSGGAKPRGLEAAEEATLRARHLAFIAGRSRLATSPSAGAADTVSRMGVSRQDLRQAVAFALDSGAHEDAARAAHAYARRQARLGTHLVRLIDWMQIVERRLGSPCEGRVGLVTTMGFAKFRVGQYDSATSEFSRAIEIARSIGDTFGEAVALVEGGHMHMFVGRHKDAVAALSRGHELALTAESPWLAARAMLLIAQHGMYQSTNLVREQAALLRAASAANRRLGFVVAEANCRLLLATWLLLQEGPATARDEGRAALDLLSGQRDRSMLAFALSRNAHISAALEHPEESIRMAREAVAIADSIGNRLVLAAALLALADASLLQNVQTAARALGAANAVFADSMAERTAVDAHFEAGIRAALDRSGASTDDDYRLGLTAGVEAVARD